MAVWILLSLAGVQCAWWLYYFSRVSRYEWPQTNLTNDLPPVSVVICFKGLPEDFESNLQSVLFQDYPDFEVILVNDYSATSSPDILQSWIARQADSNIRIIHASRDIPGKKQAQQDGVLAARNKIILFTDMDCRAADPTWIRHMVSRMHEQNADVVLGYGPMDKKPGLVAWFAGFETVLTALQYVGFHLAGETYMSVGRNWLVKKSVYQQFVHAARGQHLASGDDDLLLQAMTSKVRVTACLHPGSFMYSAPKTTWQDFFRQKSRHISTSFHYPFRISAKLFIFSFSLMAFYALAFLFLWFGLIPFPYCMLILLAKWLIQMISHRGAFNLLDGKRYTWTYPLAEMVLVLYFFILPVFSAFQKNKHW